MDFERPGSEKNGSIDVRADFCNLGILLVDKNLTSLLETAFTLEELTYKVTTGESMTEALSIIREKPNEFGLVMADIDMPEMDFVEFMKHIQLIKDIPIILMSTELTVEMVGNAVRQGICFVFQKPISKEKLMNVWEYVEKHQQRRASEKTENNKAKRTSKDEMGQHLGKKDETKGSKRKRSSEEIEETGGRSRLGKKDETKGSKRKRSSEEIEETGGRSRLIWTPDLKEKFNDAVIELGDNAVAKSILKKMNVPNLTPQQVTSYLQKYRMKKQTALQSSSQYAVHDDGEQSSNIGATVGNISSHVSPRYPSNSETPFHSETNMFGHFPYNAPFQGDQDPFIVPPDQDNVLMGLNEWKHETEMDSFIDWLNNLN